MKWKAFQLRNGNLFPTRLLRKPFAYLHGAYRKGMRLCGRGNEEGEYLAPIP